MVNCKFCKTILCGIVLLTSLGFVLAKKTINESVMVECTPGDKGTLYPHPDCTKYYECASGQLFTRDCGPGTYFNTAINQCDFPYNVSDCKGGTRPPETSPPPSYSTTVEVSPTTASPTSVSTIVTPTITSAQTTSSTPKDTNTTTPIPNWCLMTEDQVKVQYPGSCNLYYICIGGNPHITKCTDGLYFNPTTQECDLPQTVNCKVKSTTTDNPEEVTDILACPSNPSIYLPQPGKSSRYYLCEYGALQALFPCSNNYKFDFALQTCKIPGDTES